MVRPVDFQRVLAAGQWARSTHFALHHVGQAVGVCADNGVFIDFSTELSTASVTTDTMAVDDCPGADSAAVAWRLGLVVPKRHAKRATTRSLLKRQARAAMQRHAAQLPPGWWVLRLRSGFDRQTYVSPASEALRLSARAELDALFARAARPRREAAA